MGFQIEKKKHILQETYELKLIVPARANSALSDPDGPQD
jgi:hypothetical protein